MKRKKVQIIYRQVKYKSDRVFVTKKRLSSKLIAVTECNLSDLNSVLEFCYDSISERKYQIMTLINRDGKVFFIFNTENVISNLRKKLRDDYFIIEHVIHFKLLK